MPSTSNSVHFFMGLYLQRMHINYRNQERQSFSSLIPHRETFIDVIDLFSAPVTHSCLAFFFFFNFEQTTKFQLNLAEDFQSNRKSLFHGNINGQKEKSEQHCKKSIGVLQHTHSSKGLWWGQEGEHVSPCPIAHPIYHWDESLQRNASKSASFLLFLAISGRKTPFKAKEMVCTSAGMHTTRWSKQRKVAITLPAVLQKSPQHPTDVLTTNEGLHLPELSCPGETLLMGLGVKE